MSLSRGHYPDPLTPIDGWSTNINSATVVDYLDDPSYQLISISVPSDNPNIERYINWVVNAGEPGPAILIEDDISTPEPARFAHALDFIASDYMKPEEKEFYDNFLSFADAGEKLTIVEDISGAQRLCELAGMGVDNSKPYPKSLGLIFIDNEMLIYSIEPQRVRSAINGDVSEIRFDGNASIRQNLVSGRVDVVIFDSAGGVSFWATNNAEKVSAAFPLAAL